MSVVEIYHIVRALWMDIGEKGANEACRYGDCR